MNPLNTVKWPLIIGFVLAVAIAAHFSRIGAMTIISTHHTSLKVYAANTPGVLGTRSATARALGSPLSGVRSHRPHRGSGRCRVRY